MTKRDPDEEDDEGDEEEEEDPIFTEEKYLVLHVQKGIHGSQNYPLEFQPDEDFLRETYGSGTFTLMQQQLNNDTGKKGWRKIGKFVIEPPEGSIPTSALKAPTKGNSTTGNADLDVTIRNIKELAAAKLQMAFADSLANKDYVAAKELANVVMDRRDPPQDDKYAKLVEKLLERTINQQVNPAGSLREQITTLKELKGLMDGPIEAPQENGIGSLAQHIPSVMDAMNKKTELDREVIRLKEKELELKAKMIPPVQPVPPLPVQKPDILDRFLFGIMGPTPNPAQISNYVAMSPSKSMIEPSVKPAFDLEKMSDEDYDEMCDLLEKPTFGTDAVIQRMRELGAQNPKYGEIAIILSTEKGKIFLSRILEIVDEIFFPPDEEKVDEKKIEITEKENGGKNDEHHKPKNKK